MRSGTRRVFLPTFTTKACCLFSSSPQDWAIGSGTGYLEVKCNLKLLISGLRKFTGDYISSKFKREI